MPTNLTPAQLAELNRLFNTDVYNGGDSWSKPSTVNFEGDAWKPDNGGYARLGPMYGDEQYHFTNYNPNGAFSAEGEGQLSKWSPLMGALQSLALVAGAGGLGGAFGAANAGAGGAGAGLGAGEATALNLGLSGNVPAELASLTSVTGPAAAAAGGAAAGAAGGAGSAAAGGAGGAMNSFGVLDPALSWGTVPAGMTNFAPTGLLGKVASALGLKGASSLLPLAATAAGALAGSQKQKQEQNSSRSIPDWLMPYYTGDKGLLSMVQNQLQRSQSPEAQAMWNSIGQKGMGLLDQPVAGNGFSKFFPGR